MDDRPLAACVAVALATTTTAGHNAVAVAVEEQNHVEDGNEDD